MYKLNYDITTKTVNSVRRLFDNADIPLDEANTDYQAYLAWVEQGNTAEVAG
jgi:hypothetical protein